MSLVRELVLVRRSFGDRVELVRRMAARATPGPAIVRGTVFASALAALLLAYPFEVVRSANLGLLLVLAVLPALRPRGIFTTFTVLAAVVGWLVTTGAYGEPVTIWRLTALAGALYVLHTTAALAAVLPYDTVVAPAVLAGWLLRAGAVLVLTAGFAGAVVIGVLPLAASGTFLAASIAGLAVMAGLAWLLAYLRRR